MCVCVCLSLPLWSILEPVTLTCSVEAIRFIFHSLHCSNNGRPMARNLNNSRVRAEETSLRIMRREDEKILVTYQTINHMTQGSSVRNRKHKGGYVPFFFPFQGYLCVSLQLGSDSKRPELLTYNPLTVIHIPPHLISSICLCSLRARSSH